MHQINHRTENYLQALAKNLPPFVDVVKREDVLWDAEFSFLSGIGVKAEHKGSIPIYQSANHDRRMRRAYKSRGCLGVFDYLKDYVAEEKHPELLEELKKEI